MNKEAIDKEFDVLEYSAGRIVCLMRGGDLAGSFSDGCDCEKCNKYARKIRRKVINIIKKAQEMGYKK